MSKRIYVGNLPFTATEDQVRAHFARHGEVLKVNIITDRDSGRPRGFGFVEMDDAAAQRAIAQENGQELGGRRLVVNEAKEREGHRGRPAGGYSDAPRDRRGRDRRERDDW